jgi:hypothetical protein
MNYGSRIEEVTLAKEARAKDPECPPQLLCIYSGLGKGSGPLLFSRKLADADRELPFTKLASVYMQKNSYGPSARVSPFSILENHCFYEEGMEQPLHEVVRAIQLRTRDPIVAKKREVSEHHRKILAKRGFTHPESYFLGSMSGLEGHAYENGLVVYWTESGELADVQLRDLQRMIHESWKRR